MPEESHISTPFKPGFRWMHFIVDVLLVNIAFHLAFLLRFRMMVFDENTMTTGAPIGLYWWFELVITIGWIVLSLFLRLYSPRIRSRKLSEVSLVLRALGFLAGVALVVIVSKGGYNYYSRIFLISFFSLSALALILSHICVKTRGLVNLEIIGQ
jgi:FlaA1/EpsC-like NDP-sugar epimerase